MSLNATQGLTKDEKSIDYIMTLANKAFRTNEQTYCGSMLYEFIDETDEQPFVNVDFENELVTLNPHLSHIAGTYNDAYLRFYFGEYPDLQLDFPIESTVEKCEFQKVELQTELIDIQVIIGDKKKELQLPALVASPKCGPSPKITSHTLSAIEAPEGIDIKSLIEFSENDSTIVIKRTENLKLLKETVSVRLDFVTEYDFQLQLNLNLEYATEGPRFEVIDGQKKVPDPITCSK